jgi:hypothetical protein
MKLLPIALSLLLLQFSDEKAQDIAFFRQQEPPEFTAYPTPILSLIADIRFVTKKVLSATW